MLFREILRQKMLKIQLFKEKYSVGIVVVSEPRMAKQWGSTEIHKERRDEAA